MADGRAFAICDATTGLPVTGAAAGCVVSAWRASDLAARTAPEVVEVGGGYELQPTDADEDAGTVVLVDVGAGHETGDGGRYIVFEVSRTDRSNQFFPWLLLDEAGDLWPGTGGTFTSWSGPGAAPTVTSPTAGVFVAVPSEADIEADAVGRITPPVGALPSFYVVSCDALGPWVAPSSGPLKNPAADVAAFLDGKAAGATTLTLATNLFIGQLRNQDRAPAHPCVACLNTGGPEPEHYIGGHRESLYRPTVQVMVRGPADDDEAGERVAREALAWVHMQVAAGYVSWNVRESQPTYLGTDRDQHGLWSFNVECLYRVALD